MLIVEIEVEGKKVARELTELSTNLRNTVLCKLEKEELINIINMLINLYRKE